MSKISDQAYLKKEQYKSSKNLQARINLHRMYSLNPYPWQRWVFDQIELERGMRFLEIGCGPGDLWRENADRLPQGLSGAIGDLSLGMVREARQNIPGEAALTYLSLDAQSIPAPTETFDRVIANHMLYHVPDIPRALGEIQSCLKPGGRLCAATNGAAHLKELHELIARFNPQFKPRTRETARFGLENAIELLRGHFHRVEVRIYEDHLKVTQVQPLLDYILSMWEAFTPRDHQALQALESYAAGRIAANGYLFITKSQGLVIGTKGD